MEKLCSWVDNILSLFIPFSDIEKTELHKCYHLFSLPVEQISENLHYPTLADGGRGEEGSAPHPPRKLIKYMGVGGGEALSELVNKTRF